MSGGSVPAGSGPLSGRCVSESPGTATPGPSAGGSRRERGRPKSWRLRWQQALAQADDLRVELAQVTAQRDALAAELVYYREEMEMMRGDPRAPL